MGRRGKRIGIYYLEKGASQRPSKVIYDRVGSSVAEAEPADSVLQICGNEGTIGESMMVKLQ